MKKLMMAFGVWCLVLGAGRALGAEPVEYLDWNGEKLVPATCSDYEVVANGANVFAAGKTYVVQGEVTTTSRITVEGTVESPTRLVLCDGAKLTAAKGVTVASDRALVICGQTEGTGTLVATSGDDAAGIGGGIQAAGGAVTINGGMVMATGGRSAAGIGGGYDGAGGSVTINGGTVTATGGWRAAGIGGGDDGDGGTVTVNGGTVTATGDWNGAGIGGGNGGAGGTVTATGDWNGAGIGGGNGGAGGAVTINGGVVTAQGGDNAAGIGGGYNGAGGTLRFAEGVPFVVWVGDFASGSYVPTAAFLEDHTAGYAHIESGRVILTFEAIRGCQTIVSNEAGVVANESPDLRYRTYIVTTGETVTVTFALLEEGDEWEDASKANPRTFKNMTEDVTLSAADLPRVRRKPVSYLDWDSVGQKMTNAVCTMYEKVSPETTVFEPGATYVVTGGVVEVTSRITVNGTVESPTRLVLCDGATLTAAQGIEVAVKGATTNALVICGQTEGTGTLVATSGDSAAGIGGGAWSIAGGAVTVNGGVVTAKGGKYGAGIGGGDFAAGGAVTINGGSVTAQGGDNAAGIGGGRGAVGGTVTFGSIFAVKAGESAEGAVPVSMPDYADDHSANYVSMTFLQRGVLLQIPEANGYTYVVSNETGRAFGFCMDGINTYMTVTGGTIKVYFILPEGFEWEVAPKANPMTFENLAADTVVPAADLPRVGHKFVSYVDWDPVGQKMTNAVCTVYEKVTPETTVFVAGKTYVVQGEVSATSRITVEGTVESPTRLILCDGATLTANAGVTVGSDRAFVICGQTDGTGTLVATGADWVAGIGGGNGGAGGAVTINGGTVIATGGSNAAGIGGGEYGAGGTVVINGGTVIATGGAYAAGIGGGDYGDGGVVTINGGVVTAKSGWRAAGIGGGYDGDAGMLRLAEGVPFAVWAGDSEPGGYVPTETFVKDHSAVFAHIETGKVALVLEGTRGYGTVVTNGAGVVVENSSLDSNARAYVVTPGETVTVTFALLEEGDEWEVEPTSNPMTFKDMTKDVTLSAADLPRVRRPSVPYLDWDSVGQKMTNAVCTMYEKVSSETTVFEPGVTYVITGGVVEVESRITVEGTEANPARLILCDGATLTAAKGITVTANEETTNALVIYGQTGGTGALEATSSYYNAGIGGGSVAAGGTVTINGGTVTAQGGEDGAGIGGGGGGAGGTITINGGVVTATGGNRGAGIGGGYMGAGGTVVIRNGAVKVVAGENASVIGHGIYNDDDGSVSVLGGIFAMEVEDGWLAEHCHVIDNPDPATKGDYPHQVITLYKLTVPQVEHGTVEVTTNGTVVAEFAGSVDVLLDSTVRVAFTAEPGYRVVANGEKEWVIVSDVTFGTTPGFPLPAIMDTRVELWQVGEDVVAYTNANGVLTIVGTGAMSNFVSAEDVPWDPSAVTAVTVGEGVTLGKNAFVTLADTVTVNGLSIAFQKDVAAAAGASEPVIPEGMVLVSKTELEAAGAETVEIVGGTAYLGVSVKTNGDLKAETKIWGNVNIQPDDVSFENGSVIIAVPANAEKGFMVLESGK